MNEQTVRPLDAYGALRYLRTRRDVIKDRIGMQGWSNGGMTVLVTRGDNAPGKPENGFSVALAEYPGCGMKAIQGAYDPYAPLRMMIAGADHNFDDPGKAKQEKAADRKATADAMRRAEAFFAANLLK